MRAESDQDAVRSPAADARRTRRWLLGILALALVLRVAALVALPNIHHPDEINQTIEQAHRWLFGYGSIPWEFRDGIRSWILPGILAVPLALGTIINPDPAVSMLVVGLFVTALSLVIVACAFLLGRELSLTHAVVAGTVAAVWFELIFHAGRTLSETVATAPLMLGLLLAVRPAPRRARLVSMGMLLGLCVVLRPHLAPAAGVIGLWLLWRHGLRAMGPLVLGGLVPLGLSAVVDTWTWGVPFASIVRNIDTNVLQGRADTFGVSPMDAYLRSIASAWRWATPVIVGLALLGGRRFPIWLLTALVILVTHSLIGHKEPRFIYPAVAILVILGGVGSAEALRLIQRWLPSRNVLRVAIPAVLAVWLVASIGLAGLLGPASPWAAGRASLEAYHFLYRQPDLCAVGAIEVPMWQTAGAVHLHRDVPLILVDAAAHPEAWNHLLLRPAVSALPTGDLVVLGCWSDPWGELCVYRKPGGCQPVAGLS